jgi:hypothetical protein
VNPPVDSRESRPLRLVVLVKQVPDTANVTGDEAKH